MDFTLIFDATASLVSLLFLVVGSISDIRTREVDDKVWLTYGALGTTLTAIRLILEPSRFILTGLSIAIAFLISIGLVYFGLTGGADAKAIICIGLALPLPPSSWQPLIGFVHPFFPVVVVLMGFICSASMALWFGIRNTTSYVRLENRMFGGLEHESWSRKALACVSGYPTQIKNLKSKFYLYPIEEIKWSGPSDSSERRFKFFMDVETDRDQLVSTFIDSATRSGVKGMVWVTPGLPMLVFILFGLVIALTIGDPIFATILRSVIH